MSANDNSAQPCGCDPGCQPKPHWCEWHALQRAEWAERHQFMRDMMEKEEAALASRDCYEGNLSPARSILPADVPADPMPIKEYDGTEFRAGTSYRIHSLSSPNDVARSADPMIGIGGAPTRATTLPTEAAARKTYPIASGVMDYFPDAICAVANISYRGNEQHNPGQPLHWARGKSTDEADTMLRHFLQRGTLDADGVRHSAKMVWRALALLQKEIEAENSAIKEQHRFLQEQEKVAAERRDQAAQAFARERMAGAQRRAPEPCCNRPETCLDTLCVTLQSYARKGNR